MEFNQAKMPDSIIENEGVCNVTSWLVTVLKGPIEIKIAQEEPIIGVKNMVIFEPGDEFRSGWFGARAIDRGHVPGVHVLDRGEGNRNAKRLFINDLTPKMRAIPAYQNAS